MLRYLVVLCLALVLPLHCGAATDGSTPTEEHHHHAAPSAAEAAGVGVAERLGEKIPLDLTFNDEAGRPVRLADLVTGPTIILPVYYRCTNVCNFLQNGMAAVIPEIRRKPGEEYRVISVSFDETEPPDLAARYRRIYQGAITTPFPENGWRFLTGDATTIRQLTDAIGYRFQRKGRDFVHPVASVVIAGDGTIIRYLYGTAFLPKDVTLALLEAREGKVGKTIRTVVGYCFSFDPKQKTYVFNLLRVSATVVILTAGAFLAFLLTTGRTGARQRKGGS
ncbi:SCO family protein [Geobacter sulfurreducens]|uniref:SCO family protein n=1 Tax=Geobacter sulfurreducens TaxID=35554 RepID=UPI0001D8F2C0|nr:SCO family protein [Geobacter sulfurreducens]ADI83056.1 cytochrome c oxidase, coo3-type, synthesis factor [Geobacter sulfurreducens KN400]AJY69951.1 cytochrome C oxidase [Geobacter sulfurreducens]QVW35491.1 SCO family protein [Geobacter sulfurreducens]UTG92930.1 SCO family protein [Geobacter sulfurreducens]